jgi:hypothetical protein
VATPAILAHVDETDLSWVRGVILLLALVINVYALRWRSRGSR